MGINRNSGYNVFVIFLFLVVGSVVVVGIECYWWLCDCCIELGLGGVRGVFFLFFCFMLGVMIIGC